MRYLYFLFFLYSLSAFAQDAAEQGRDRIVLNADRPELIAGNFDLETPNKAHPFDPVNSDGSQQSIIAGDIVINEFLAVNDSLGTTRDSEGETDDWIELYNNTDTEMDLSDVFLSDNPENKFKWQFPAGTSIPAAGYLIVWCDEDGDQPGLHASFKLNRDGEQVFLSNADGSTIDEIDFGFQQNNISVSRVPNGTGNFVAQHTTFKYSNDTPVSTPDLGRDVAVRIFPNPVANQLTVDISGQVGQQYTLDVISSFGQVMRQGIPASRGYLNVTDFTPGLYLLTVRDREGRARTLRFVKE